jgi:hypothetical protein
MYITTDTSADTLVNKTKIHPQHAIDLVGSHMIQMIQK